MKKQTDDSIHKVLKEALLEKAPEGMVHRIMNQIVVQPVRRISVSPVKTKPVAVLLPVVTVLLLGVAFVFKPQSLFGVTFDPLVQLQIDPIWIALVTVLSLAFWMGILLRKYWEPLIK